MTLRAGRAVATVAAVLALSSACTTVRITATSRSSIEQRLLVRALERAAARVETGPLLARRLRIEMSGLTPDAPFARDFFRARLETRGLRFTTSSDADVVTLHVFATALAVDTAETLFGIPAMQVPVLAVPIPEIALFKWERSRGHAQTQFYTYDDKGQFLDRIPEVLGEAKYDRFTVLIFISFSMTDLDRPPDQR